MKVTVDLPSKHCVISMQECAKGHVSYTWCSQPRLPNRIHCGDFLASAVTLFSGQNYAKLALWAKLLNLPFPTEKFFLAVQKHYLLQVGQVNLHVQKFV
jgi:hypothetical protein